MTRFNASHIGKKVKLTKFRQGCHAKTHPCIVYEGLTGIVVGSDDGSPLIQWSNGSRCFACTNVGEEVMILNQSRGILEILNS